MCFVAPPCSAHFIVRPNQATAPTTGNNNDAQEKCKLLGEIEGGAIEFNLSAIIIHPI